MLTLQPNSLCLGDAVHRHPPFNGLGSNSCIQDAFNLAWKVAYVHRGLASPSLLSTYSTERQPVGQSVVQRANDGFRDHFAIWEAIGILPEDVDTRRTILSELRATTPAGQQRRRAFQKAIETTAHEFHGLGIEMNQVYKGPGIYAADEAQPYKLSGRAADDPVLYHIPSTYPGCRLPHVWLNKAVPVEPVSTIDLAGHGAFVLFTGVGGEAWKQAANSVAAELGVSLSACSIGYRQDWEDVYYDWERVRGVEETGVVLVRPDRFVAWRRTAVMSSEEECRATLLHVLKSIFGLQEGS